MDQRARLRPAEGWIMFESVIRDLANLGNPAALAVLLQVLIIDITMTGDNAIVVGALAASLPPTQRRKVIAIGVMAALVFRVGFALIATKLLRVIGLVLAGGLLLLWIAWKMWREMPGTGWARRSRVGAFTERPTVRPAKGFAGAVWAVAMADLSMSLDNVLGIAGAAKSHPGVMIVGLFLAVVLMGVAANVIANYIERYRWIAWVGIIVIVWVASTMIVQGFLELRIHGGSSTSQPLRSPLLPQRLDQFQLEIQTPARGAQAHGPNTSSQCRLLHCLLLG
jgi:YjbE family integral membrane protein